MLYKVSITTIFTVFSHRFWELKEKYSSSRLFVVLLSEVQLHTINSGLNILNGTFQKEKIHKFKTACSSEQCDEISALLLSPLMDVNLAVVRCIMPLSQLVVLKPSTIRLTATVLQCLWSISFILLNNSLKCSSSNGDNLNI